MSFAKTAACPESGVFSGWGVGGKNHGEGQRSGGRAVSGRRVLGKSQGRDRGSGKEKGAGFGGLVTVRPCPRGVQGERRRRFELDGLGT